MTTEKWLPAVGFEGIYEVSDQGRVRSVDRIVNNGARTTRLRGRILKQQPSSGRGRYLQVSLQCGKGKRTIGVHRLVLAAFRGECPPGMECLHANDIGTDNRLDNLSWGTRSANTYDKVRNGRHPLAKRTHCAKGHEFTPENTIYRNTGWGTYRRCLACRRREDREAKRRQRNAA